jgi:phosphoribosyl-AMP cyclohydrolase
MALPLLAAVSISPEETGLSSADLSRLGYAYLEITDNNATDAVHYIFNNFAAYHTVANVTAVTDNAVISEILNAGASRAVVTLEQYAALKGAFADARLAVKVSNAAEAKELPKAAGLFVDAAVVAEVKEKERCILASFKSVSIDAALEVAKLGATPIIPREQLTVDPEANPGLIPVAAIVTANITSDREDGLLTTIVVDEQGVALGLVYSSPESVKESFRTGTGVYQSRKRGLWYKGATSGAVQELVRIDADCDGDCLRFFVRQKGAGMLLFPPSDYTKITRCHEPTFNHHISPISKCYTTSLDITLQIHT